MFSKAGTNGIRVGQRIFIECMSCPIQVIVEIEDRPMYATMGLWVLPYDLRTRNPMFVDPSRTPGVMELMPRSYGFLCPDESKYASPTPDLDRPGFGIDVRSFVQFRLPLRIGTELIYIDPGTQEEHRGTIVRACADERQSLVSGTIFQFIAYVLEKSDKSKLRLFIEDYSRIKIIPNEDMILLDDFDAFIQEIGL